MAKTERVLKPRLGELNAIVNEMGALLRRLVGEQIAIQLQNLDRGRGAT